MPWDPKPPPPAPAVQQPPQPRQPPPQYVAPAQHVAQNGEVKVKLEPTDLASIPPTAPVYTHHPQGLARENAAQHIRDTFGDAGAASIQQIQRMNEAPHGVKRPLPQGSPTQEQFDVKRRVTGYQGNMGARAQQQVHNLQAMGAAQRQPPAPVGNAQNDGAADWKQMVAERRALLAEGSAAADMTIAERVAAMQRAEEGNGVMQPHSKQKRHRVIQLVDDDAVSSSAVAPGPSAFDGVDDDDDDDDEDTKPDIDDADAINSDLDDDDEENLEDDDEDSNEIMVCTYEKVARVKNKWKCVLRDGILITGGKE